MPSVLQYQEQARKRTKWLVLLYTLCLCCIVAVFYFIPVGTMWWAAMNGGRYVTPAEENAILWQPQILLWVVGIVGTIVGVASLGKTMQLSAGGTKVAESLGGRRVLPNTRNRAEKRLLNVVEEMAIASRIAIPAVYVLDGEPGINAFAAGYSSADASVAVTAGALEHFNREELQAVVALACLEDVIASHEGGLDFNVGFNGEKLSGRQTVGSGKARFEGKADLGNLEIKTAQ